MGSKVEGTTPLEDAEKAWFHCRLTIASKSKSWEAGGARPVVAGAANLIFKRTDENGRAVTVIAGDRLEINIAGVSTSIWSVTGDPLPIRKRKAVLGWKVPVNAVTVHERVDVAPTIGQVVG